MSAGDEKRAKIIAQQAARQAADVASGKVPSPRTGRANWAATPKGDRNPFRRAPRPKREE